MWQQNRESRSVEEKLRRVRPYLTKNMCSLRLPDKSSAVCRLERKDQIFDFPIVC